MRIVKVVEVIKVVKAKGDSGFLRFPEIRLSQSLQGPTYSLYRIYWFPGAVSAPQMPIYEKVAFQSNSK